ncbi:lanthionine synthetase C family protein [Actinocorallia populi]|uniref:lanthionine synthetase C family protein n=1 Tax=Actinocorallia populi TaxID=2079200 RepID=UPI000D095CD5|nr:lanthionine synthetase C family protein [Actinocorallia populi]
MNSQPPGQSLADGAAGRALLHVERALQDGEWSQAQTAIREAVADPVDSGPNAGLYYGAPAVAFVLTAASTDGHPRYLNASHTLDEYVRTAAERKLTQATEAIRTGRSAIFADYDLFKGLTGFGALLLARVPGSEVFGSILTYLTCLTRPRVIDGLQVPGWWVDHHPDPALPTPGGHANLGMAHGAAGILALLALAARAGHIVNGQREAIESLIDFFDRWRQDSSEGPWWPQWLSRDDLRAGLLISYTHPGRPSWCYGAVGIARALQLAADANGQESPRKAAETALAANLTDHHLARLDTPGLCHGLAGVYQTAYRAACEAQCPSIAERLPTLAARLAALPDGDSDGMLTGTAGIDLAAETARRNVPPVSDWDRCLLIT